MDYKHKLESQISEQFGKLVYSYTCHWEEISLLKRYNNLIKWGEIVLTAASATGIVSFLIYDKNCLAIIGAIFSTLSLALTLFSKEYNLEERIIKHQNTADDLWLVRENYISLLTDLERITEEEICKRRDKLVIDSSAIYKAALPTSSKAYSKAKKQLKNNEYQFFTQEELNKMMPSHLRKTGWEE